MAYEYVYFFYLYILLIIICYHYNYYLIVLIFNYDQLFKTKQFSLSCVMKLINEIDIKLFILYLDKCLKYVYEKTLIKILTKTD